MQARGRCLRTRGSWAGPRHRARAACTFTCGSSSAGDSMKCVARRWRWRVRWSVERRPSPRANGGKRSGRACSWTTTRTRKTERLHRPIPYGRCPTHASPRPSPGTKWMRWIPRTSRSARCQNASRRSATGMRGWTSAPAHSRSCWSSRRGRKRKGRATPRGRRTIASRRANRPACSRPKQRRAPRSIR